MKIILKLLVIFLPWKLKRLCLNYFWKYQIHPKAHIGFSFIYPKKLIMEEGAQIGHLNVAIHLEQIQMGKDTIISQQNWITGFPLKDCSNFYDFPNRRPYLIMEEGSAISKKHHIDCTDLLTIGKFTSIGGYGTQILTHSTSLQHNEQACGPITIGHHCFIGTRSVILPNSILPDQSVLGAGAVMKKQFTQSFCLYGGVPAKFIKEMDMNYAFFHRTYRP